MSFTHGKLGSRSLWPYLTAMSLLLGACSPGGEGGPGDQEETETVHVSSALEGETRAVELYAQLPFDVATGVFDLDDVDYVNEDPIWSQNFTIPYDLIEEEMRQALAAATAQPFEGEVSAPLDSHVLWSVKVDAAARFSNRGQPRVSKWSEPNGTGVYVDLDNQVAVDLNAHVHIHATSELIPDPPDFDVAIRAFIGGHGHIKLGITPSLSNDDLRVWATWDDGGNIDIQGLDGYAIGVGAVIGGGIGLVLGGGVLEGAFLGGLGGEEALDQATSYAKEELQSQVKELLADASAKATKALNEALQPKIKDANDIKARFRKQPLPGVGLSLYQIEDQLAMTLDQRSVSTEGRFRTAYTARFANPPAHGRVNGVLRFPKRQCLYREASRREIGTFLYPVEVVDANQQMRERGCGGLDVEQLLHSVYYGQNPDRVLKTGAPENNMVTWGSMGAAGFADMQETETAFECPFAVIGLPGAAFVDVRAQAGSELAHALSARQLAAGQDAALEAKLHAMEPMGGRFVVLSALGETVVLDHTAETKLVSVDIGAASPSEISDCPPIEIESGTGVQAPYADPRNELDPEGCTTACDGLQVTTGAEASNPNPGAAVLGEAGSAGAGNPTEGGAAIGEAAGSASAGPSQGVAAAAYQAAAAGGGNDSARAATQSVTIQRLTTRFTIGR